MALQLLMNGQSRTFDELAPGATILLLVQALQLKADRIALEVNGEIVPRSSWNSASLSNQDRIELVHFVGGGRES